MADFFIKTSGSDSLDGLSDANAWATLAKLDAEFPSMSAGDTVSLNGGDTFTTSGVVLSNSGDNSLNPIIIQAYGTGKPILRPADVSVGMDIIEVSSAVKGVSFLNLRLESDRLASAHQTGFRIKSDVFKVLIKYCEVIDVNLGLYGSTSNTDANSILKDLVIQYCNFTGNRKDAILCDAHDFYILDNYFFDNGNNATNEDHVKFHHTVYIGAKNPNPCDNVQILRNTFIDTGVINGISESTCLVAHGTIDNFRISENKFYLSPGIIAGGGSFPIGITAGNGTVERFNFLEIDNNYIASPGNTAISISSAHEPHIHHNVIVGEDNENNNGRVVGVEFFQEDAPDYQTVNPHAHHNVVYGVSGATADQVSVRTKSNSTISGENYHDNELVIYTKPLKTRLKTLPQKGTLTNIDEEGTPTYTYDDGNAPDTDSFKYLIEDSTGKSNEATVNLTISASGGPSAPTMGTLNFPAATNGVVYSYDVTGLVTGAYDTIDLETGSLPAWLTLSGGIFSGTPDSETDVTGVSISATYSGLKSNISNTDDLVVNASGGGALELTLDGVDEYMTVTPIVLALADTVQITFNSSTSGVEQRFFDASSGTRFQTRIDSSDQIRTAGVSAITIDGNVVANTADVSAYLDGLDHILHLTLSDGRDLDIVGSHKTVGTLTWDGTLKDMIVIAAAGNVTYNIDSGSITTQAADVGSGTMTFVNIESGDWT